MGVIPNESPLEKRQIYNCNNYGYYYDYNSNGCYYSGWNAYGRWVLLAVIVIAASLLAVAVAWNQQGYYNQPNGGYNPNNPGYNVPPPAYGQQYGGASAPQQPGPIYQGARGGENVYDNTPGKKDNVVR
ncbi:MAG: hypothetical protein LQ340_002527 [Diploschistes diacapsis]|nr:MAG: hypothetical protein LQ340_002527 [Diploschistes diacapsis]